MDVQRFSRARVYMCVCVCTRARAINLYDRVFSSFIFNQEMRANFLGYCLVLLNDYSLPSKQSVGSLANCNKRTTIFMFEFMPFFFFFFSIQYR